MQYSSNVKGEDEEVNGEEINDKSSKVKEKTVNDKTVKEKSSSSSNENNDNPEEEEKEKEKEEEEEEEEGPDEPPPTKRIEWICTTQWFSLKRQHAEILANLDLTPFTELEENQFALDRGDYILLTALLLNGADGDEFEHLVLNDVWRHDLDSSDTITWTTFTEPKPVALTKTKIMIWNLLQVLCESQRDTESFFFRTISKEVDFSMLGMYPWYSMDKVGIIRLTDALPESDDDNSDDDETEERIDLHKYAEEDAMEFRRDHYMQKYKSKLPFIFPPPPPSSSSSSSSTSTSSFLSSSSSSSSSSPSTACFKFQVPTTPLRFTFSSSLSSAPSTSSSLSSISSSTSSTSSLNNSSSTSSLFNNEKRKII